MGKKLYVGNLAFSTTQDALQQLFAQAGTVESATIISDRVTGRSKGFGFVEMASDQEATDAITKLNGQEIEGRAIVVSEARPQAPRESRGGFGGGGGRGGVIVLNVENIVSSSSFIDTSIPSAAYNLSGGPGGLGATFEHDGAPGIVGNIGLIEGTYGTGLPENYDAPSSCNDAIDNDVDGFIDMADYDCFAILSSTPAGACPSLNYGPIGYDASDFNDGVQISPTGSPSPSAASGADACCGDDTIFETNVNVVHDIIQNSNFAVPNSNEPMNWDFDVVAGRHGNPVYDSSYHKIRIYPVQTTSGLSFTQEVLITNQENPGISEVTPGDQIQLEAVVTENTLQSDIEYVVIRIYWYNWQGHK